MKILVAYGSKHGATAGIAETVAEALRAEGFEAATRPAGEVRHLDGFDAVVLGGALYARRWQRDARVFVRRHRRTLRQMPVWVFSSGPLDDSASVGDVPPTERVESVAGAIGARGHATFGGALAEDVKGFVASRMAANGRAGDWRDPEQIHAWARDVAAALRSEV